MVDEWRKVKCRTHPLGSEVGILCLLLTGISPVHGIVLLKLHGLHLLLDGVHCCSVEVRWGGREDQLKQRLRGHGVWVLGAGCWVPAGGRTRMKWGRSWAGARPQEPRQQSPASCSCSWLLAWPSPAQAARQPGSPWWEIWLLTPQETPAVKYSIFVP